MHIYFKFYALFHCLAVLFNLIMDLLLRHWRRRDTKGQNSTLLAYGAYDMQVCASMVAD